jgi:hypothetical protein
MFTEVLVVHTENKQKPDNLTSESLTPFSKIETFLHNYKLPVSEQKLIKNKLLLQILNQLNNKMFLIVTNSPRTHVNGVHLFQVKVMRC